MRRLRSREVLAYAVLVAVALGLRLYDLGDRPFHHDESQDAYFSWILFTQGDYAYNPLLHGPLRFYLTATMYALFGDSDFTARLAPALMGTAMVAMPYFLRRQLGRIAAFTAAVLLAIGPSYLYFSRFAREDIYFAAISLALLVVVFRFLDEPRRWHPALIGALIALGFATKETMYIAGFVAFTFFAILLVREGRGGPTRTALRSVGWEAWVWALASFAATFTLMFTVFLTNPAGLWDGLYESLAYWLGQHEVGRGGEKPYFYVVVLFGEEWPVLLLGAVGAVVAFRQPTVLRAFLVWGFALSLAIYSWAGEKFAWLVLHPLLPLILLAGLGVQALWEARGTRLGKAGLALAAVAALYVPVASWWSNVELRADPRSLLVSTQSSEEVKRVADEVRALARKQPEALGDGRLGRRRDVPVGLVLPRPRGRLPRPQHRLGGTALGRDRDDRAGLAAARPGAPGLSRAALLVPRLVGARLRKATPGAWLRWLVEREVWNPTGGLLRVPLRAPRRHQRQRGAEPRVARHGRDAAPRLNRVLRRADERAEALELRHHHDEPPQPRRVAAALDDLEDRGAEPEEGHRSGRAAEVEAGGFERRDGAGERAGERDDVIDHGGAVGVRRRGARGSRFAPHQRQPVRPLARQPLRCHAQDPAAAPRQPHPRLAEHDVARRVGREPEPLPRRRRVAELDQRSCHTVVPSRSNTRRPSWSHFARPASPWSARSIGPTTT